MERVSRVLLSALVKQFPDLNRSIEAKEPSLVRLEDFRTELDSGFKLIAPTLNITIPEVGGPDLEDIIGYTDTEYFLRKTELTQKNSEKEKKLFNLERFNAIGEDYVEGIGNTGSLYNADKGAHDMAFRKGGVIIGMDGEDLSEARKFHPEFNPVGEIDDNMFTFSSVSPTPIIRHHRRYENFFKNQERQDRYTMSYHAMSKFLLYFVPT